MVFFHHYNNTNQLQLPEMMYRFTQELHTGVAIFFVLSGFLISFRYYDVFRINKQWVKQYAVNRIARIYPMYLLLTILTFAVLFYQTGRFDLPVFISNITFLRGFFDELKFSGIAQGWSLTAEECFYFSAPFIFLLYNKKVKLIFIAAALWIAGFALVKFAGSQTGYGFMATNAFMLFYTFFGRCVEFLTGVWLAFFIRKQFLLHKTGSYGVLKTVLGGTGIVLVLLSMVTLAKALNLKLSVNSLGGILINNLLLPVMIAVFFAGLLMEQSFIKRLLESSFMQLLGKSSYVFYLIHMGFFSSWLSDYLSIGNHYLRISTLFVLLNIIAISLYLLVEEPLNKYIRNRFVVIAPNPAIS